MAAEHGDARRSPTRRKKRAAIITELPTPGASKTCRLIDRWSVEITAKDAGRLEEAAPPHPFGGLRATAEWVRDFQARQGCTAAA